MSFDNSINIVGVVSLVALLTPLFTTIINFLFQLYFKQFELYELAKREALMHFINDFSHFLYTNETTEIRYEALNSMFLLQLYFKITPELQNTILEAFNNKSSKIFYQVVTELSKQVNKRIK